ncbi:hypothetical protein EI94DRAFT_1755469, partial [Lactarius quietus]
MGVASRPCERLLASPAPSLELNSSLTLALLPKSLPLMPISTDAVPFVNPATHGGSLLDRAPNTGTPPLGEPLNVIISGESSPAVLTNAGFVEFANAIGFGIECFGAHLGDPQSANLGDGHDIGSCLESLLGGNHLRLFRQNGPTANTGALFLAVSQEENVSDGHNIVPNGYNLGRDQFVSGALGVTTYQGVNYQTVAMNLTGMLPPDPRA